jgi:hypothetical protein
MSVKNWVKRIYKRLKLKWNRWGKTPGMFKLPEERTGYEQKSMAICRKMITHPDSKFTIAPLSGKRYIVNKTLDIFVIILDGKVEITNHVYHYVITLSDGEIKKLVNFFDSKVDDIRIKYEEEIKSQIGNTLDKIYEKITKQEPLN